MSTDRENIHRHQPHIHPAANFCTIHMGNSEPSHGRKSMCSIENDMIRVERYWWADAQNQCLAILFAEKCFTFLFFLLLFVLSFSVCSLSCALYLFFVLYLSFSSVSHVALLVRIDIYIYAVCCLVFPSNELRVVVW